MYTVGSLFTGIGAMDLAFVKTGKFDIRWQVEIDPFCRKVLKRHNPTCWPNARLHKDVHDVGRRNLEPVDVMVGGFPCQPISNAGNRKVYEDSRYLWPEFARIIGELRPRLVFLENVDEIVAPVKRGGEITAPAPALDVLGSLSEMGMDAQWAIVGAESVGASHIRLRWWCVAYPNARRRQESQSEKSSDDGQSDAALSERGRSAEFRPTVSGGQGMGYAAVEGLSQRRQSEVSALATQNQAGMVIQPERSSVGVALGDTNSLAVQGLRSLRQQKPYSRHDPQQFEGTSDRGDTARTIESGVGRAMFNGFPARLDRLARTVTWAAPQGLPQFADEPPRITTDNDNRANRVKAIGNAVVVPLVEAWAETIALFLEAQDSAAQ